MKTSLKIQLLAVVGVLVCASISGAAIIAEQDGETVGHTGWNISGAFGGPVGSLTVGGAVTTHGDAGKVEANTGIGPDVDFVYNEAGLVGNYYNFPVPAGGNAIITSMDAEFYTSRADNFRLYMLAGSGPGNMHTWYYDAGPLAVGWNTISSVPFTAIAAGDWYSEEPTVNDSDFAIDIANVTRIGFVLQYLANASQTYGFDHITLNGDVMVPEPETYLVLVVALASLAFVFREQLRQMLGTALATITG
jgi:hypothetical protein